MAGDPNDVVRHVILRILVDQAGLAESLAEARAKLKELEGAEKQSNDNRVKDSGRVEKAYDKQRDAVDKTGDAVKDRAKEELSATDEVDRAHDRAFQRDITRFNAESKAARDLEKDKLDAARKTTGDLEKVRLDAAQKDRNATQKAIQDQQKLNQELAKNQHVINDAEQVRSATQGTRIETLIRQAHTATEKLEADTVAAEHLAETRRHQSTQAGHDADAAGTAAEVAAQRAIADVTDRRVRSLREARTAQQNLKNLAAEGNVLEEKALSIATQRIRAEERLGQAQDKNAQGLKGWLQNFAALVEDAAILGGRAAASAPQSAVREGRRAAQSVDQLPKFGDPFKDVTRDASAGEKVIASFFRAFGKGSDDAMRSVTGLKAGFKAFFADVARGLNGGGGQNIFGTIASNIFNMAESLTVKVGDLGRHFASMESIIIAVVAALGPLAAILGAVGAAALGLASNLAALSGVLFALPGILTAIVGGFGALAIVMKPLTSVISAYTAAQKEAITNTNAAKDAALDYKLAVLQQQDAEVEYNRTKANGAQLERNLADARKDATRQIEDYRTALKKLKYDEEGSQLGVESAQEQARRALADPTASNLDRREALHNVQGALFDQQDQATQAKRTREDAAEAFKYGVDGNQAVIAAQQALEDQTNKVQEAYLNWQKAIIATQKAGVAQASGGNSSLAQYEAQLKKLSPSTRKVAEAFIDLIKDGGPFQKLRSQLSENIFGPVSKDTGKFKDILNELGTFLTPISVALGGIAKAAVEWLDTPSWKAFFSTTGTNSGKLLTLMADAAMSVADAFKNIMVAAAPFTSYLVGAIGGVAKEFDNWTKGFSADPKGNGLVKFLEITKTRIGELWPIVKNFAAGLAGFFTALNTPGKGDKEDFTTSFNKGILSASAAFKKLGQEAAEPNSGFRKWLREVKPLLKDVAGFIASAGSFFGKLFSDPRNINEAKNILKELSTQWLPKLADIFGQIADSGLISKLANGIGAVFGGIEKFLKNGGTSDLKIIADDIKHAGDFLGGLISAFSSMPGILKVVGETIAFVFGATLFAKFSGLLTVAKGVFGVIRSIVGIVQNVKNVDLGDENGTSSGSKSRRSQSGATSSKTTTSRGGVQVGAVGEDANKPGILSRARTRIGNIIRPGNNEPDSSADLRNTSRRNSQQETTSFRSRVSGATSRIGRFFGTRQDDDENNKPSRPGVKGRLGQIASTAKSELTGVVTGSSSQGSVLERIEKYTRQIEINTRRGGATGGGSTSRRPSSGGGTGGAPGGGASITDDEDRRRRQTAHAGTVNLGQSGEGSVRSRVNGTVEGGLGRAETAGRRGATLGYSTQRDAENAAQYINGGTRRSGVLAGPDTVIPAEGNADPSSRRQTTTTGYSAERQAANERRAKVGLKPLPPDITTTAGRAGAQRNTGADAEINRVPEAIDQREEETSRRRQALDDHREARLTSGTGTVPRLDYVPEPAVSEPEIKETPKQRRQRRAQERADRAKLGSGESGAPLTNVGRDLEPYGLDERGPASGPEHTVPTEEENRGKKAKPPRDPDTGKIVSPYNEDTRNIPAPEPAFEGGKKPTKPRPKQTRSEGGQFGANEEPPKNRKSRRQAILDALHLSGDEGSVGLGIGTRDDEETTARRTKATKVKKPSRLGKLGGKAKGLFGGLLSGVGAIAAGTSTTGDPDYDEGYESGYQDALANSGGGGGNLPGRDEEKPGKRGKAGRRGLAGEADDAAHSAERNGLSELEQDAEGSAGTKGGLLSRIFRRGGAKGVAGVAEEGLEDVATSGKLGGLARIGGGLAKGLTGGIGGLVVSGAAQLGGDYLTNKFVKNADDRSSLSRGLGAVGTGAGIGATIGSIIPGVGTVVGGAIGGLAGGAYSLFKDKNLRNFVGGKLSDGAHAVGGALSGAAKGVGNFFGDIFGGGDDQGGKPGGVKGFLGGLKSEATSGLGGGIATALGPIGLLLGKTDIGKSIVDSLNKAGGKIGQFFTKTIPDFFHKGVKGITDFFTKTLPGLPKKFVDFFFYSLGRIFGFFTTTLPDAVDNFFTVQIPKAAKFAWKFLVQNFWDPFVDFIKAIPGFFTKTIPHWFETVMKWRDEHIVKPLHEFITVQIPKFFTQTIPHWFEEAPKWFSTHVITPITNFFTKTIPNFFTQTLPNAISQLPSVLYNYLIAPVISFFSGLGSHIGDLIKGGFDWVKGLFSGAGSSFNAGVKDQTAGKKMSGGLITGVYQGIEDTARVMVTPGEMVIRRAKTQEPGAKMFLQDFNERGMEALYAGLSATAKPPTMSMVAPDAQALTGRVPTVVNNTINHAPVMGDVTINNPVREKSETTLRRQIHVAAIRHRR